MRYSLTVFALFIIAGLVQGKDPTKKVEDIKAIQGKWKIERGWRKGRAITPESSVGRTEWHIKGNEIILKDPMRERTEDALFKLDPSTKPPSIDVTPKKDRDEKALGIYEIKGDTLRICFSMDNKARPTEFAAPEGSRLTYVILKRVKE